MIITETIEQLYTQKGTRADYRIEKKKVTKKVFWERVEI
tara:strand:- start:2305 stop:2421 length:117 start_codon:yes stop_codon:yes gene_type:complete